MIYFTADTHFSHTNIIKYCSRPFSDSIEMDKILIERWNEKVKPDDIIYHLGDFAWLDKIELSKVVKQLNGQIFLIKGNHDKLQNQQYINCGFKWVGDYKKIKYSDQTIILCHYAMRTWEHSYRGSWMLFGHSHSILRDHFYYNENDKQYYPISKTMDVGVDTNNFYPYSFDEIHEIMKLQKISYEHVFIENDMKGKSC